VSVRGETEASNECVYTVIHRTIATITQGKRPRQTPSITAGVIACEIVAADSTAYRIKVGRRSRSVQIRDVVV